MDYAVQATYYRTALLLGLVRGDAVHRWAEQVIEREAAPSHAVIEIASISTDDLSALRHALWPLVRDPEPPDVLHALLGRLYADLTSGRRGLADTLTVLRQMRSMLRLPPAIYADLNGALVAHAAESEPKQAIASWLCQYDAAMPGDDGLVRRDMRSRAAEARMDLATLTEFATKYTSAWCSQHAASVAAFFAELGSLTINDGPPAVGRNAIAAAAQSFMTAFPDMIVTMDGVAFEGHGAVYRWTLTGTNTGSGGTGKRVRISGYEEWTFDDDRLIEQSKGHFDQAEYTRQIGA